MVIEIENEDEELTTCQLTICLLCAIAFLQYFIGKSETIVIFCILIVLCCAINVIIVSLRFLVGKWEERKRETAILKKKNEQNTRLLVEQYFPDLRRNTKRLAYLKQYTGTRHKRNKRMKELKEMRLFLTEEVESFETRCHRFKRNKELEGLLCTLNKEAAAMRSEIEHIKEEEDCIHSVKRKLLLLCHVEEKEERQSYKGLPPPLKTYDRQALDDYETMVDACQRKHKHRKKYR